MYTAKKIEKNKYEIKISATHEQWEEYVEQSYEENKGKFSIEGFRKGKAPRRVIEKNYGDNVFFDDALDALFTKEYNHALDCEKEITPVAHPQIKIDKFDETGIEITATVEVLPEVELGAYTGLTVKKATGKVEEAQVEKELNQARERQARFVEVDREAKDGDFVVIDFVGSVDGVEFEGGKAEDYRLGLGSHTFIPGFEEQIVGMKTGEKRDINVTFPEDYQAENLKGKASVFAITLKKVEEKQLPELNDEFASNVSDFETLEEFKNDLRKHLQENLETRLQRENENNLIEAVVKGSTVEVPNALIEQQLDFFVQDFEYRLAYQGIKLDDYLKYANITMEELRNERREQATETVKTRLVLEAIVKKEHLEVTQEELDGKLLESATKYKKSLEDYKKSMGDKNIAYVENDILMKKLLKLLTENNTLN